LDRVESRFDMLAIFFGYLCKFFGDKLPSTSGGYEELNMFQGGRSNYGDRFSLFDSMIKTHSKVTKHQINEISIEHWCRTPN